LILVDANLLLYAKFAEHPQHSRARAWLEGVLGGPARVGLPWSSLLAFLRIGTNPRIYPRPLDIEGAWAQVLEWLALDGVWIPLPTERHAEVLGRLIGARRPSSPVIMDAHLAALAVEHGLTVCSTDADFAGFAGIRWENPIAV
jgi:hypothetical protein